MLTYKGILNLGVVIVFLFSFVALNFAAAQGVSIEGRIGSSIMILRPEVDEIVERSILVQNFNSVPVTITMTPDGDLADNIELDEEEFILLAGEERKVGFTIFAEESGKTLTKINVGFTPAEGNGVGLVSKITVIAGGSSEYVGRGGDKDEGDSESGNNDGDNGEESDGDGTNENMDERDSKELEGDGGFSFRQGNVVKDLTNRDNLQAIKLLLILTGILVVALVILYFYSLKTIKPEKKVDKDA